MPDKIKKIFCDLKHRFSWGLRKWLERFPFKERKAFLSRMSWQYKEVWGNVILSEIERNFSTSYRLVVQQNWKNRQVVTFTRGWTRVWLMIHAHASTCLPRSVRLADLPEDALSNQITALHGKNKVIRSYTKPQNCRWLRKPHTGFFGSVKCQLRTHKLLSCG